MREVGRVLGGVAAVEAVPEAATTSEPVFVARRTASYSASDAPGPPTLRLITLGPAAMAASIPAITAELVGVPMSKTRSAAAG